MDRLISSRQLVLEEDIIEVRAFIDLFMIAPQTVVDKAKFCCMQLGAGCAISLPAAPAIGLNRILGLATLDDVEKAYEWMTKKTGRRYLQMNTDVVPLQVLDWIRTRGLFPEGNGWAKAATSSSSRSARPRWRSHHPRGKYRRSRNFRFDDVCRI